MPRYIVERTIPGASRLNKDALWELARRSEQSITGMEVPYYGVEIRAVGNKIYCIHKAETAAVIYRRAYDGGFPADLVTEIEEVQAPIEPRGILHQLRDERGF
jgi:hypothetical protein